MRIRFWIIVLLLFPLMRMQGQLTIDNAINANAAVQNVLLGDGVSASGITFQGDNAQIGGFNCNNCGLGIGNGVVIGSGNVDGAVGPNNTGSYSLGPPGASDGVGDPDLESLSGMSLNNTAVLEFDFVPTGDSLAFNYVFSSEEYPEYVNSINDAFGFFLSGPGINGPYSNNSTNIALVPNSTVPISINTVNVGENSSYYIDNGGGFANVQADAFTTVLTAYAQVICGESYHIKIVIGDAMDNLYDSWVYLEAGSFQSNILSMSYTAPNYSSPIDGGVYEGCQAGNLVFTRSGNVDNELSYNLTFGGDAIIGSDINFPYSSIVFPAGEENVTLTFQAIQDLILEGVEVLEITMENAGCGSNNATLEINVYDLPALEVTVDDALINCGETATFTPSITGGLGDYTVVWPGGFEGASYTVAPTSATTYSFTVSDTCGVIPFNGLAAVNFIQNPTLVVEAADDMSATCLDVQNFQPQISGGLPPYSTAWYVNGVLQSVNTNLLFSSNESVALELEVTDFCGVSVSDVFNYDVPAVPIEIDLGSNLSVQCIDEVSYTVAPSGGVGTYSYDWFIDGAFNSSTASFSHYFFSDAIVSIEVSDQCGNTANDQVNIAVPAVPVQVLLPEDITTNCLVTSTVVPTVTGGAGNIDFEWTVNGANYSTNTTINYTTPIDVQIALSVEDECDNSASDVMSILIPPAPISVLVNADTTVCLYDGLMLAGSAQGGVGDLTLSWDGGSDQETVYVVPLEPTEYRLYVQDQCGHFASASVNVGIDYVQPNFTSAYLSDDVVSFTNVLSDSIVCFWDFSDGSVSNEHSPVHQFMTVDPWVATLHAYTPLGCHNEVSQEFQPTGAVFIPSMFTPDGDGINEIWKPVGRDLVSYHVRVFNRFGEIVFESRDMEEFWTGEVRKGDYFAPNGVYSFILQATDARYNSFERSGHVTLVR